EKHEFEYVANKLEISLEELNSYLVMTKKWYFNYKNEKKIFDFGAKVLNMMNRDKAIIKR
ncbi:LPS biosynthesis protein, partial [Alphaproteobacteria bacterium]|nr:LPS biosynthesis protein [Alphaproteobacteria bacterium]